MNGSPRMLPRLRTHRLELRPCTQDDLDTLWALWAEPEVLGRYYGIIYPDAEAQAGKPAVDLAAALERGRLAEECWQVRKD